MSINPSRCFRMLRSLSRWWSLIGLLFLTVALLDFFTPPDYMIAYLYMIPILASILFFKPGIAKVLLGLSVFATLLNLVFPTWVLNSVPIVINRLVASLSLVISCFFMVRYVRNQKELRENEQLLATEKRLSQMREDFIATLTHDLKTPMLGEDKTLQYYREGAFGPLSDEQHTVISAIQRGNQRQLALVESLLSVYRYDNLGVSLSLSAIDMDALVADSITELQHLALERQINLSYICEPYPPVIKGDSLQLKRVLANLIHNGLNYTPSNGSIMILLAAERDFITLSISDTGPGLSPDALKKLFHRFYRADTTRAVVGTGLGLYLSRQIILAHRGKIRVENLTPTGCRFTITLPLSDSTTSYEALK